MKHLNLFLATVCCVILASCGKNKDVTLTPESTKIRGDLKEYFTVVEKPYIIKYDEKGWNKYMISIELQRTDVPFAFDTEGIEPVGNSGVSVRGNYGIGIDINDADGNLVISWSPTADGLSGVYSNDDLENLFTLESGETGRVRWSTDEFEDYKDKNFTFKVSSSLKIDKNKSSRSNEYYDEDYLAALERDILEAEADLGDDEDMYESNSSEDWDAILDSYDRYMDQYVKVMKKVNAGDANAYSEMMSLMQECNELNEKLASASDDMSVAQATRFQKIAAKMASAAAQM